MSFDDYLKQVEATPSGVNAAVTSCIHIGEDWMQGRAGFGGLVAGLVYESMRKQLGSNVPVRCLQVSFVGPVDASPLEVTSEVLRQGKNVSHVLGRGMQNGEVKILVQGSFGQSRASSVSLLADRLKLSGTVAEAKKLPHIPQVIPEFTKHFDFRYLTEFPFSGSPKNYLEGYVRLAEPCQTMTEAHVLALIDAWPPTTLPMFDRPCMASSLSWTIEFIQPHTPLRSDEYLVYRADIVQSEGGYAYARAKIANEAGELIAISQQTTTHFA